MTKKERILAAFADATVDHVPVCFWWHFNPSLPHDEMVAAHLKFFHDTDEDLMKISSDGYFGWPAEALKAPHDVKKLYKIEHIPLSHPYMRGQIDRVKAIVSALNGEAMTVYTTFNPLSLIRLQVGWDLEGLSSTDPIITLEPEDGVMEAVFWDTDATYAMPEAAADVDAAAAKAKAAFEAFRATLRGKDELNAYVFWLGFMACRGGKLVIANKIGNIQANAMEQALSALAFKDAGAALDLISDTLRLMTPGGIVPAWVKGEQSLPEAPPPLWGLALCRVFAGGGIDAVDKDKLAEGYALLTKAVDWWLKNRSLSDGSFFYAYAHESGWDGVPVLPFGQGAVTPDLAVWMALNAGALEAMAKKLGLQDEAANWAALMQKQLAVLASLWKDGKFACRSALTGEEVPCPVGIGLLPLLLGDAAPGADALRAKAEKAERLPKEQAGLIALECPALAGKLIAAGAAQPGTLSGGAYRPVLSALLLALEERS